ncbi:MAG: acyltransferase [Clostridia bacterium]|nr:acyltransferase [Clostridia bacterium]
MAGKKVKQKIRAFLGIQPSVTGEQFVEELRKQGARIGERVVVFDPKSTVIDMTRPYMLEIGDDVQIPFGVSILTHGYDWSVLKGAYGEVLGSAGKVKIGNNVFIGSRSTILKGVTIGNNVIIGACSLVNKDIPDNCVAAGNPCRVIMPLDEYYQKRKDAQEKEAAELVRCYRKVYDKAPGEKELSEFFFLYTDGNAPINEYYERQMRNLGNYEETLECLRDNKPFFTSMEDFLNRINEP